MSRTATLLVGLLLALGLLAGCGDDDSGPDVTEVANFEVDLPDGWTSASDDELQQVGSAGLSATEEETGSDIDRSRVDVLAIFRSDATSGGFQPNANVFRESIGNASLRQYLAFSYEQLARAGAEITQKGSGPSVGGEPSRLTEYETSFQGSDTLTVRTLTLIRDGDAYNITLTALPDQFDDAAAGFDQIVSSWQWSE